MQPRLRLFTGDDESHDIEPLKVNITFGELSTILQEACRKQRAFLRDFEDDEIQMTEDLYQVLTAYCRLRPGA
ncbi:MAG: hypothetical protein DWH81_06845 [Planctomycetota bacterium]|nr:MAG: hypothetical protein DWH81_06845 [Planctomycetota bacterium]